MPLLAQAGREVAVLAEMAADDAAARSHDAASLAAASLAVPIAVICLPLLAAACSVAGR